MRRIAVIMACHNRCAQTLACLRALGAAELELRVRDRKIDVFLVDDGSTDRTEEAVKNEFSHVHIIKGDGSLFWAKGMRLAWDEAEKCGAYDFYLWLNDDVVLKQGAIASLLKDYSLVGGGAAVIVGPTSTGASESRSSYSATTLQDEQIFPSGEPQQAEGWFNGNCVLIPREVYEKVGMIDGSYSHGRADYDYAERLKLAGIPFYCASQFVGVCVNDGAEKAKQLGLWWRARQLFVPSNRNVFDLWRFRYRYYGAWRAIKSCGYLVWLTLRGAK